jgi:hypothetical protein
VDTAHNAASLVALTRTLPDLDPERIIAAHQAALSTMPNAKCRLHTTTAGPSRRQILILLEAPPSANTFPTLVGTINHTLGKKVSLRVQSFFFFEINNLYTGAQRQTSLYLSTTRNGHSIERPATEVKICPEMSRQLPQITWTVACATFPR